MKLAESLLEINRFYDVQKEYTEPVTPERDGGIPTIIKCKSDLEEKSYVTKLIIKHVKAGDSIGIFYRSYIEKNRLLSWLHSNRIMYEEINGKNEDLSIISPGVKISTLHSAKGLEFDTVIIPFFSDKSFPLRSLLNDAEDEQRDEIMVIERSLLYVGMTRAKQDLYITFNGSYSMFLREFDPEAYRYINADGQSIYKRSRILPEKMKEQNSNLGNQPTESTGLIPKEKTDVNAALKDKGSFFDVGDKVKSPFLGVGTVVKREKIKSGFIVTIKFRGIEYVYDEKTVLEGNMLKKID